MKPLFTVALLAGLLAGSEWAHAQPAPAKPTAKDKCPVCGMFVSKYPDFLAQISFQDGSTAFFDGAKDLFKFYLKLPKCPPGQNSAAIIAVYVADYYSLSPIDGRLAYFVVGSDVYGPMGKELIAFERESDAKGFMKDHQGKSLLRFEQVTTAILKGTGLIWPFANRTCSWAAWRRAVLCCSCFGWMLMSRHGKAGFTTKPAWHS